MERLDLLEEGKLPNQSTSWGVFSAFQNFDNKNVQLFLLYYCLVYQVCVTFYTSRLFYVLNVLLIIRYFLFTSKERSSHDIELLPSDRRKATTHRATHFGDEECQLLQNPGRHCNRVFATHKALSSHVRQCRRTSTSIGDTLSSAPVISFWPRLFYQSMTNPHHLLANRIPSQ